MCKKGDSFARMKRGKDGREIMFMSPRTCISITKWATNLHEFQKYEYFIERNSLNIIAKTILLLANESTFRKKLHVSIELNYSYQIVRIYF
jgi:hypothetical protein